MINILDKNRASYRKQVKKITTCSFCSPEIIKEQGIKNLEGKFWHVLINKYPYMDGNVMIIPKRHVKEPKDLIMDEWIELQSMFSEVIARLSELFECQDYNIGLNVGHLAGASIEHMHWQIIPRKPKIQNSANIFGEIQIITISPSELKKSLEDKSINKFIRKIKIKK